jgi:hypothetical protein
MHGARAPETEHRSWRRHHHDRRSRRTPASVSRAPNRSCLVRMTTLPQYQAVMSWRPTAHLQSSRPRCVETGTIHRRLSTRFGLYLASVVRPDGTVSAMSCTSSEPRALAFGSFQLTERRLLRVVHVRPLPTCEGNTMHPCPKCAALVKDDATDCRWCQAPQDSPPEARAAAQTARDTKRCPFCAEEILFRAVKCKHCQSDLTTQHSFAGSALKSTLPFLPVPGATPTSGVLFFLLAFVLLVLAIVIGPLGPILLVLGTSLWVGFDASTHKLDKYESGFGGPTGACLGSLLLWIFVFPWYLAVRSRIRAGVQPIKI